MANDENNNAHDEKVRTDILKIQLKADLEKVIYGYGEQEEMTCLDVIEVLAQLTTDMVKLIHEQGDGYEDAVPEEEQN